jgi:hypothetical protein
MTQSDGEPPAKLSEEAIKKCERQQIDCWQTAEAFQIRCESLSRRNAVWLLVTVVVTVVTMVQMLLALGGDQTDLITGALILVTTGILAGYFAFNRPPALDDIRDAANQFVALSDQFEHVASMGPKERDEPREELMARFYETFDRLLDQKFRIWQAAPLTPISHSAAKPGFLRRIRFWLRGRFEPKHQPTRPA